jgi:hypothetical protein
MHRGIAAIANCARAARRPVSVVLMGGRSQLSTSRCKAIAVRLEVDHASAFDNHHNPIRAGGFYGKSPGVEQ